MTRVKSVSARAHRKLRAETKGFKQARRRRVKAGHEALMHAGQYAYIGRKLKKRDLRNLWIKRLNAAAREQGTTYSHLISDLKAKKVILDRKILADIAATDPITFEKIVNSLK